MSARARLHPRWFSLGVLVAYVGLAASSTWPLIARLGQLLPLGSERETTVPLASSWALWWSSDRIASGFADFWDAPILHPASDAFAFSEPMPMLGALAAPAMWLGGSPALAHGVVVLLALVANGWMAVGLLRRLGAGELAAAIGGAMFVMLPYVHDQLGVLALVPMFGLLLSVHALLAWFDEPIPARGALVGLALGLTYYSCAQHAVFFVMAAAPAALFLVRRELLQPRAIGSALVGLAVTAALILPMALSQRAAVDEHGFSRAEERAREGAASLASYARSSQRELVPVPPAWVAPPDRHRLFPGAHRLALGIIGLLWLRRHRPRLARFLAALAAVAFAISVLPRVELGAASPWHLLRAVVPGLEQVRSIWRAGVLVQLVLTLGAALGIQALIDGWMQRGTRRHLRRAAVATLALLAVVELWPRGQRFAPPPSLAAWQPFAAWVEATLAPDEPLLHLPMPRGLSAEAFQSEARHMYLATAHGRPLANGYSSYWPASYNRLRFSLEDFPGPRSLSAIDAAGVRVLVIERHWLAERRASMPDPWSLVFENDAVQVFAAGAPPRAGDAN